MAVEGPWRRVCRLSAIVLSAASWPAIAAAPESPSALLAGRYAAGVVVAEPWVSQKLYGVRDAL